MRIILRIRKNLKAEFSNNNTESPNHFRIIGVKTHNLTKKEAEALDKTITRSEASKALQKWDPSFKYQPEPDN